MKAGDAAADHEETRSNLVWHQRTRDGRRRWKLLRLAELLNIRAVAGYRIAGSRGPSCAYVVRFSFSQPGAAPPSPGHFAPSPERSLKLPSTNSKLVVLIITAFVDMMGTLMVVPLLFFYQKRMGGNGLIYTMLVSTFSLATLTAAPLWGRFSDRYGRRPTLLIALGASAISYVIFGFANSLAV